MSWARGETRVSEISKKVLIIQHVGSEGPGTILPVLINSGYSIEYTRLYLGELPPENASGLAGLVILGGPMGVSDADKYPYIGMELKLIDSALKAGLPILGICLGAQLMAHAAGARVYRGEEKEIGWYELSLTSEGVTDKSFSALPKTQQVFQWHGETFDLPSGSTLLASSKLSPNQAFRIGDNAYALQFHFEVTEEMIKSFIEANPEELSELRGVIDPQKILTDTRLHISALMEQGPQVFTRIFGD